MRTRRIGTETPTTNVQRRRPWLRSMAVMSVAVIVVAACGGDDDAETTGSETTAAPTEETTAPEPETTEAPTEETTAAEPETTEADTTEPAATTAPTEVTTEATESQEASSLEGETVRLAVASTGLEDLPLWPAIDQLESQGVSVEVTEYADGGEAVRALALGRADVTHNAFTAMLAAVNEGAPVKVISGYTANGASLVARSEFDSVESLDGARVGIHGETSFTKAAADFYAAQAGVEFDQLIVPGSEVRAQALMSDQLDATILFPGDIVTLLAEFPDDVVVLGSFSQDAPDLLSFVVGASDEFVDTKPELAAAYLAALVDGYAEASELASAMEIAEEHYSDFVDTPELLAAQVEFLVESNYWPLDGSLTPETCQSSIEFLVAAGQSEGDPADHEKFCSYDALQTALSNR